MLSLWASEEINRSPDEYWTLVISSRFLGFRCQILRAQVLFLWASEEINRAPDEYWTLVMDVARRSTLARVRRCSQIMGREESDDLSAAQVFYPCMQCADVFYLKARPAWAELLPP